NIRSATLSNNLCSNGDPSSKNAAIQISYGGANGPQVGVNNLTVSNNTVTKWAHSLAIASDMKPGSGAKALNNLKVTGNSFQDMFTSGGHPLHITSGSNRTPSSYASDFLNRARAQSEDNWDSRYTASAIISYLKGG